MKNIHVLPTDKPSRLHNKNGELGNYPSTKLYIEDFKGNQHNSYQNIYITSDEEIKNDDWVYCPVLKKPVFICLDSILMFKNLGYDSNGNSKYKKEWLKKIILTTDPDLIKDGVQAIDDEFLEWFVNNPSCEEVEVNHFGMCCSNQLIAQCINCNQYNPVYKIIIPKEESKQETLEEAAHEYFKRGQLGFEKASDTEEAFLKGAKWMQERMYSEEDMREAFKGGGKISWTDIDDFNEWFEQFKKK